MELKAEHRLDDLLAAAGLARSTFYYHQARLDRPDPKAPLKQAVGEAFAHSKGRYGHRRIHAVLVGAGWQVAKKTVLAVMRELGLRTHVRQRRRYRLGPGPASPVASNVLNRQFTTQAPNRKWVSDVTEFHLATAKAYLSPVLDLFDRQIIAHTFSTSPNLDLTNGALDQALSSQDVAPGLIVHTDQGHQYRHTSWRDRLAAVGAIQSMSRRGNCYDNAVIENFFGHLKTELAVDPNLTVAELGQQITDYITWWNTERIHSGLAGMSPVQYRAQALAA